MRGLKALFSYPRRELWRLFVDGALQASEGFIKYDMREPGALAACFRGLAVGLQHVNNPLLSEKLISDIHAACTQAVEFPDSTLTDHFASGQYTRRQRYFKFNYRAAHCFSVEGIAAYLRMLSNDKAAGFNLNLAFNLGLQKGYVESKAEVNHMLSRQPSLDSHNDNMRLLNEILYRSWRGSAISLWDNYLAHPEIHAFDTFNGLNLDLHIGDVDGDAARAQRLQEISACIYTAIMQSHHVLYYFAPHQDLVKEKMQTIIASYNEQIVKASTREDKLCIIIVHVQQFMLLHPFNDANSRTFVNVLLNRLLMQHDMLPATFSQSNVFYFNSVDQIAALVTVAMNNTALLINGEKNLFNCMTNKWIERYPQAWAPLDEAINTFDCQLRELNELALTKPLPSLKILSLSLFAPQCEERHDVATCGVRLKNV